MWLVGGGHSKRLGACVDNKAKLQIIISTLPRYQWMLQRPSSKKHFSQKKKQKKTHEIFFMSHWTVSAFLFRFINYFINSQVCRLPWWRALMMPFLDSSDVSSVLVLLWRQWVCKHCIIRLHLESRLQKGCWITSKKCLQVNVAMLTFRFNLFCFLQ